jgi:RimJ/RimL family protein N-acetyltransferase
VGAGRIENNFRSTPPGTFCLLSYTIAPDVRGRGFGTELVRLLVVQAQALGYTTIGARIRRDNLASIKCALSGGVNAIRLL